MNSALRIDLNADLGEGLGNDGEILPWLSSVSIACGGHAGDAVSMAATVRAALAAGVAIGAHPGYPDRSHFGRRALALPWSELAASLREQILALQHIATECGARLAHVKLHGALYNQAAHDTTLALRIAQLIGGIDHRLAVYVLAGSPWAQQTRASGLRVIEEAFADRAYRADGRLMPRDAPGAVLTEPSAVVARALTLLRSHRLPCTGGVLPVRADSLCIHGDTPGAAALARALRQGLETAGVQVRAPGAPD